MNGNFIEIVKSYLKFETSYALIINGNYGIGKTFFFKNLLFPEITKISIPSDERIKYIPIHISLFGVKTVEDIQSQIFLSIYPLLKNKSLKLAAGIAKSLMRGIAQINKLGDIDKYIADVNFKGKEWINYNRLVVCFDDLDRKSDTLDIKDIFGFINTLVENDGAKVIIIANEDKLRKDNNYTDELREKVIGVSIEFKNDLDSVYEIIINERYSSSSKIYHKYLNDNKEYIKDVIRQNGSNLRNLIFFLEHFKEVFYPLNDLFETDKNFVVLKEDKLKTSLEFSLAVSIEYKLGNLNSSNFDEIKKLGDVSISSLDFMHNAELKSKNDDNKESYSVLFKNKYFKDRNYYYLNSIFIYLIGQSVFKIEELKTELESIFVVEDGKVPENQKLLYQLGYFDCLDLSDNDYRKLTYKMLEYVYKGKYQLEQFPTAFHFATRFDNILGFDIVKLKERFKKGIKKGKAEFKYSYHLHFRISIQEDTEFKEDLKEIAKYCNSINEEIRKELEQENLNKFLNLFETNFNKFYESVQDQNGPFKYSLFWSYLPVNKIYRRILRMSNKEIIDLGFYFRERYKNHVVNSLYDEKDFLLSLKHKINFPKNRTIKNLRNASLDFLIKHIENSIISFP